MFNPGGGVIPDDFPYAHFPLLRWQPGANRVEFSPGVSLKLAPFFGSIGVAPPPLIGRISSHPPGWHGGNLDNKDLVAGSTLYLPVHVPGGLLSIGDGHGMQGDGEVTGTALETSLRGTFEVRALKGQRLRWPHAERRASGQQACLPGGPARLTFLQHPHGVLSALPTRVAPSRDR